MVPTNVAIMFNTSSMPPDDPSNALQHPGQEPFQG